MLPLRACLALLLSLTTLTSCSLLPGRREPNRLSAASGPAQPAIRRADGAKCLAALGSSGARYAPLADRYYAPGCQAVGSVRLDRLAGDRGSLRACQPRPGRLSAGRGVRGLGALRRRPRGAADARQRARTDRDDGQLFVPQRRRDRAAPPTRAPRPSTSALSCSADGRRVAVKTSWNGASAQERAFLRTVHASACKRFGTVLGPGYNAAHADHLHVELGNGSFCR